MKINRTVIIIILSGIYIGLMLSGAFRKLEYLEGDVSDTADRAKKYDALIEQGATAEEAIEIILNSPRSPPPVEVREKIDAWIKRNNLDTVGNPIGTMYTGGTPLFDENTGMSTDRYVYIINNHRDKPWNTEDDAVGIKPRPVTDFAPSPRNDVEEVGLVWTSIDSGENWIEEEERLGSLPLRPGSTLPTKPGQNAVLGNPPTMNIRDQIELGQDRLFSDLSEDEQADILAQVTESLVGGNSVDVDQPRRYSMYPNHWTAQPILYDSIPITDPQYKRIVYPEEWNGKYGQSGIKLTYDWIVSNLQTDAANMKDDSSYVYKELPQRRLANTLKTTGAPGNMWNGPVRSDAAAAAAAAAGEPFGNMLNGPAPSWEDDQDIAASRDYIVSSRYDGAEEQRVEATAVAMDMLEGDEPVIQNTPTASPEEVAARYEGAEEEREEALETVMNSIGPSPETATDEASDKKNMNIGIGIGVGVLALFLILFTYYKLRRRY